MKSHSLLTVSFASILIGLHTTTLLAQTGQGESLGDYARRMLACENFPPLCKDEAVADAVRQIEPLDEKQLGRFVLRFRDLDKDFPERAEWEHDLFTGKQAFVKAYRDMERIKESCQSSQGAVPPACDKRLAQAQEILTRAKGDFLRNVKVGQDKGVPLHESLWPHESQMMKTELTPSPGTRQTPTDGNRQDARVAEYIARYSRLFDVYRGEVFIAVKPVPARPGDSTYGLGVISQLEVEVMNRSPESRTVNIKVSCGSWSDSSAFLRIPSNTRYSGTNRPFGQPSLIYTPGPDCTLDNLHLDTLRRDIW